MGAIAFQITSLTIVFSAVYSDADQRNHQSSESLAFVRGIHRGPVNSPHKWLVTRRMFPFDDVIMSIKQNQNCFQADHYCHIKSWKLWLPGGCLSGRDFVSGSMKAVVIVSDDTIQSAGAETGISRDKWVNSEAANALPRYPITWQILSTSAISVSRSDIKYKCFLKWNKHD